ncbi:MAG TPA: hypothetical protein PLW69_10455 [Agitococcus sp.]|jgi:hypothetical protein|nr:hypothetical protein [Agitococcus sp.]
MSEEKDSKYFSMSEAWDEIGYSYGAKDKAVSSLKLLGKGLFNTAKFTVTEALPAVAVGVVKASVKQSDEILKRDDLSTEQRERVTENRTRSEERLKEMESKKNS